MDLYPDVQNATPLAIGDELVYYCSVCSSSSGITITHNDARTCHSHHSLYFTPDIQDVQQHDHQQHDHQQHDPEVLHLPESEPLPDAAEVNIPLGVIIQTTADAHNWPTGRVVDVLSDFVQNGADAIEDLDLEEEEAIQLHAVMIQLKDFRGIL